MRKTYWTAVVLHVKRIARKTKRFREVVHDLDEMIERVSEFLWVGLLAVPEARLVLAHWSFSPLDRQPGVNEKTSARNRDDASFWLTQIRRTMRSHQSPDSGTIGRWYRPQLGISRQTRRAVSGI
jgi:hypothetical protein